MAKVEVRRVGSRSDIHAGHASAALSERSQFDRNARPAGGGSIPFRMQMDGSGWMSNVVERAVVDFRK